MGTIGDMGAAGISVATLTLGDVLVMGAAGVSGDILAMGTVFAASVTDMAGVSGAVLLGSLSEQLFDPL